MPQDTARERRKKRKAQEARDAKGKKELKKVARRADTITAEEARSIMERNQRRGGSGISKAELQAIRDRQSTDSNN